MFGLFRRKQKPKPDTAAIVRELEHVYVLVAKLNIPVIADDVDAGYDMAIDEALDIIDGRIRFYLNPTLYVDPTTDNTENVQS